MFDEFLDELTVLPPELRKCLQKIRELDYKKEELSNRNSKIAKTFFAKLKKVRPSSQPTEEDEKQAIEELR